MTQTFNATDFVPGKPLTLKTEWEPGLPKPGELSDADKDAYRRGRDALCKELGRHFGGGAMVIEC